MLMPCDNNEAARGVFNVSMRKSCTLGLCSTQRLHTGGARTRPLLLGDEPPEPRRPWGARTGVTAGEEASAARRAAVSPASAALPLYAGIPLAGAASASGPWAGPAGVAALCGVLGGGFGVAPPFVNDDTEVPWPVAAFCRIRSGSGPGIK